MTSLASGPVAWISSRAPHAAAKRHQVQYAFRTCRTVVVDNLNLGLVLLRELHQSASRPEVEAKLVGDLDP